jgi:hypothetical protein
MAAGPIRASVNIFQCVVCDAEFQSKQRVAKCCGGECKRAHLRALALRQHATAIEARSRVCLHCGVAFTQGRRSSKQIRLGQHQLYCSRVCAAASKRLYATKAEAKRAKNDRARVRKGLPPVVRVHERQCACCGSVFKTRSHDQCEACRYRVPRQETSCLECGVSITGTAKKRYCNPCRVKRSRIAGVVRHGRTKKHRHRARKYGVPYEPVSPVKIFERDGWRCQICGVRTPRSLRGTYKGRAPELDHRIPMAMGGAHTYSNTQCACRACNLRKGGREVSGQMQMFP